MEILQYSALLTLQILQPSRDDALNYGGDSRFRSGAALAACGRMGFKTIGEIKAYGAARALKLEVYRLVKAHPAAYDDHRFRSQLFEAAASVEMNIVEGFRRYSAGEFAHFLRIARASLEETTSRIQDGIDREHFTGAACKTGFELADEAGRLITGLITSLRPFVTPTRRGGAPSRKR